MPAVGEAERRCIASLERDSLVELQLEKVNALLSKILPTNSFYAAKLAGVELPIKSLDQFRELPLTTKDELTDMDRQIIGASKRITIPLGDAFILRDIADMLRGLALQMEVASKTTELPLRSRLMNVRFEIDSTNRKIRDRAKQVGIEIREGRRPLSETREQTEDKEETVSLGFFNKKARF